VAKLVCQTSSLSHEAWCASGAFADLMIQAMHSGGFTRFLSGYFAAEEEWSYARFYRGLFAARIDRPDTPIGGWLERLVVLWRDYAARSEVPTNGRVRNSPDLREAVRTYNAPEKTIFWPFEWAWITIHENREAFYADLCDFLESEGVEIASERFQDLLSFQQDIMLTEDLDPETGKTGVYTHDWPRFFFGDGQIATGPVRIHFRDTHMGSRHQHPLVAGDRHAFAMAALGNPYLDGRGRRYYHQPDRMEVGSTQGDSASTRGRPARSMA
jgi:hypothetical protein